MDPTISITLHASAGFVMTSEALPATSSLKSTNCNAIFAKKWLSYESNKNKYFPSWLQHQKRWQICHEVYSSWYLSLVLCSVTNSKQYEVFKLGSSEVGLPSAGFTGQRCDIERNLKDSSIEPHAIFCRDLIVVVWNESECGAEATTSQEYVNNNPQDFQQSQWLIKLVDQ